MRHSLGHFPAWAEQTLIMNHTDITTGPLTSAMPPWPLSASLWALVGCTALLLSAAQGSVCKVAPVSVFVPLCCVQCAGQCLPAQATMARAVSQLPAQPPQPGPDTDTMWPQSPSFNFPGIRDSAKRFNIGKTKTWLDIGIGYIQHSSSTLYLSHFSMRS